jgi:hypothetical protein
LKSVKRKTENSGKPSKPERSHPKLAKRPSELRVTLLQLSLRQCKLGMHRWGALLGGFLFIPVWMHVSGREYFRSFEECAKKFIDVVASL